ncbi:MAG: PilZ domain-containing protein [Nitrospira sp.]
MPHVPHTRTYQRFLFHSPLIIGGESCVCEGTLRNLSMHGCTLVCDREFSVGSTVRVSLLLPDETTALPIEHGRITWTQGGECGVEVSSTSAAIEVTPQPHSAILAHSIPRCPQN